MNKSTEVLVGELAKSVGNVNKLSQILGDQANELGRQIILSDLISSTLWGSL